MFKIITIRAHQVGLHFRDDDFVGLLDQGTHCFFDPLRRVEVATAAIDITAPGAIAALEAALAARGGYADRAIAVDAGLRAHMIRVYNYMASAVALTGVVAWLTYQAAGGDAIAVTDSSRQTTYYNRQFTELFGYTREELNDASRKSTLYADPNVAVEVTRAVNSGNSWMGEVEMRTRGGADVFLRLPLDAAAAAVGEANVPSLFSDMTRHVAADGLLIDVTVAGRQILADWPADIRARRSALDAAALDPPVRRALLAYRGATAIDPRPRQTGAAIDRRRRCPSACPSACCTQ